MISLSLDEVGRVVHTIARGSTSREEIEAYLVELAGVIETAQERWGRCLHLVDASRLSIRTDPELRCLAGTGIEFHGFEDRVAVVIRSQRSMTMLERMPSQFLTMVFRNRQSALDWLCAGNAGEVEML